MAERVVRSERFVRLQNLVKAVRKGSLRETQELCKAGVSVNCTSKGVTPLHVAAAHNHVECADFLLQNGALVNQTIFNNTTPLHVASRFNSMACVVLFINYGADVKAMTKDGMSALHLASRNGHSRTAEILICNGAEVNGTVEQRPGTYSQDENLAPLHFSARHNHPECIEVLVQYGADLNSQSGKLSRTPLHITVEHKCLACSCVLLSHNADLNVGDFKGNTPLHTAVTLNEEESTQLLLQAGADIDFVNNTGKKPIDLADGPVKSLLEEVINQPKSLMFDCIISIRRILFDHHGCRKSLDDLAESLPIPEAIKLKLCLKDIVKMVNL